MLQQIFRPIDIKAAKEDMYALFEYQKPKSVPNGSMCYSADFSVRNAGQDIAEVFHNPEAIYNATNSSNRPILLKNSKSE